MKTFAKCTVLSVVGMATACVYAPVGPSVMTLPGSGMSFEQFRLDDYSCRQFASTQVGETASQAAVDSQVGSALVGSAIGAAAGAAIGGGQGAAIGAGTGLAGGALVGAGEGRRAAYATQENYDNAYIQCMYAKGHQVPVTGEFVYQQPAMAAEPSDTVVPPPPTGMPPPPPSQ